MAICLRVSTACRRPIEVSMPEPSPEEAAEEISALMEGRESNLDEPTAMRVTLYLLATDQVRAKLTKTGQILICRVKQ